MGYPSYGRNVAGRDFRPETLSAVLLRKLVQDAESRIGPVRQAVITIPEPYFDDTRRKAVQDAGKIAGLDVLDILDEPTAAALAYSFQTAAPPHPGPPRKGGGRGAPSSLAGEGRGGGRRRAAHRPRLRPRRRHLRRDAGALLAQKRFQTLAIEGDVRLGGKDWDDKIVDHVAGQFVNSTAPTRAPKPSR